MTKYEWERQLKKGISNLPKSEQQRVLDYYNELFADKIDAGMREQYIIAEFGNPYDVANKILVDYYTEGKGNPDAEEYVYSPVDEIDDSFVEVPLKGKKAKETKVEVDDIVDIKEEDMPKRHVFEHKNKSDAKRKASITGLIFLVGVLIFFVLGACFDLWHPAWLVFLALPVITSFAEAIRRRNPKVFAYPVFIALLYLFVGFYYDLWHPLWVLFITIPVYYALVDFITKNSSKNEKDADGAESDEKEESAKEEKQSIKDEEPAKKETKSKGSGIKTLARVLLAIVGVCVIFWIWCGIISMFAAGIGLMAAGVGGIVWLVMGNTSNIMIVVGGSLVAFGLGLVFTFGMACLFKPCGKVTRELSKAMIGGGKKENE